MRKTLLLLLCLSSMTAWAQTGGIKGQMIDKESGEALIGATVTIQGTSIGAVADVEGNYVLNNLDYGTYTLLFNFVGYTEQTKTIELNSSSLTIDPVELKSSSVGLEEVMVLASVAVDRKTPVAVSRLSSLQIEETASNQEFPELLKSTPGVYATKQGGGFGDARINIRGFESENVAVMINGIPVNDMENGAVYWSNWAGLTAVASDVQVQRGLGASKVAVPSIGGTINIVTKAADTEAGGTLTVGIGNNGYETIGLSVSTGLMDNGWASTIYASKTTGEGWATGLQFEAYNYFFNLSKMIGKNHTISLTGFGAPQTHGQRSTKQKIDEWKSNPEGLKYNADWGYLNGEVYNRSYNYYHKPQFSLNHYWTINETSELSTSVYASYGVGGGRRDGGDAVDIVNGQYDYNSAFAANVNGDGEAGSYIASSVNNHKWYGLLSTYTKEVNQNLDLMAGIDLRQYTGIHYYEVTDLLGAEYVLSDDNLTGEETAISTGGKYNKNYEGLVGWQGVFVQGEYELNKLTAFVNASLSNTSYAHDEMMYTDKKSDSYNFIGYQVKGGANFNLTDHHNVFGNLGYFSKAPIFDAVFNSERSNDISTINEDAENEKVLSYEIGYGYRSEQLNVNVNLYRTSWLDKAYTSSVPLYDLDENGDEVPVGDGETTVLGYANILGVDALHQGIEVDFRYQPTPRLEIRGMASLGDWVWASDVDSTIVRDQNTGDIVEGASVSGLFIKDLKVGNSAQTTFSGNLSYELIKSLKFGVAYNYFGNLYSDYSITSRTNSITDGNGDIVQSWKAPDYSTVDLNLVYSFKVGDKIDAKVIGNVNNLLDTEYISDASDSNQQASGATVFYGLGRTWTATLKFNF
ncbi:TonB-dependent receptor [Reichenbachiella agariperforans]|uniref:Outer membrane receptor for Fe3+-dicitrate n=1 Tax=Reichenbachiella agariperforans TaxID=156994 RepID=A0A1M6KFY5_REIAG|nr:TonB-dependent receptor [Reichenbachiella agariperforans]MBU2913544.1 TonB-dependent receptor [Reichenbachiella agariperforans]SHJ57876.1 Outer membrane receptor for Fe3+-dicitrate [Reichenbachiella agariperforans]